MPSFSFSVFVGEEMHRITAASQQDPSAKIWTNGHHNDNTARAKLSLVLIQCNWKEIADSKQWNKQCSNEIRM